LSSASIGFEIVLFLVLYFPGMRAQSLQKAYGKSGVSPPVTPGMARASLSTGSRSHLFLPSRNTCTSLYIVAPGTALLQDWAWTSPAVHSRMTT
jgi:hypothetical protein